MFRDKTSALITDYGESSSQYSYIKQVKMLTKPAQMFTLHTAKAWQTVVTWMPVGQTSS